jgi:hypothetical protein
MKLFGRDHVVGVFRGFSDSGMEFHADLVLPYRESLQSIPMHGQFVLVQLEHEDEAVLGRITSIAAEGRLVSPIGEDYAIRAVRDERPIPEELRDQYLKYRIDIRVLGVERVDGDKLLFVPSHRRLPHVGAKVALCSDEVLAEVANATDGDPAAAEIGFLAFGEFVYTGDDPRAAADDWIVRTWPAILPKFQVTQLVSRRSFVFARAGFGKSNLIKLLFSRLYATDPVVRMRSGPAPVGTVIFDPDGEYFWPDSQGRPGLCDVPWLADRLVVFTSQQAPSLAYQSFVVDRVKLDIRQLSAQRVLGIALPAERQDQQNVTKLKALGNERWTELVNLIAAHRYNVDPAQVRRICGIKPANEEVQTNAIIGNMVRVVDSLHDPSSQMLRALRSALAAGKLCVVDISQLRGQRGLHLAGIILAEIFAHNQNEFTKAEPRTIPVIAVVEEAQAVLGAAGSGASGEDGPFVSWVKEGRRYELGAVLITQQPGSMPSELLSQGDNFFVFHLLSAGDLVSLKRANAHFSDDLLATLLNEPLVGHGVFWSSAPGTDRHARPYPLPVRVLSFEAEHRVLRDGGYSGGPLDVYAAQLRGSFQEALAQAGGHPGSGVDSESGVGTGSGVDAESAYRKSAISALRTREDFWQRLHTGQGVPWGMVQAILKQAAPSDEIVGDRFQRAKNVVRPALLELLGPEGSGWRTEKRPRPDRPGASQVWIFLTDTVETVEHATPPDEQP